jgi:NTE family protein
MKEPTVALALGGGGARGLAHIHAIEAFDDLGLKPAAIAGTSIGAIIGAGYASGMSGAEIRDFAIERFRNRFELLADLWKLRPESVKQFLDEGGPRLGEISIERVVEVFLPSRIAQDFSQLEIPLQVIATDYYRHREHVFASGPLRPALAASAAIPAVFLPVKIGGEVYIDGGMTDPTPFDKLAGLADLIVAIDVTGGPHGRPGMLPRKVDVMYGASQLMQKSISRAKAERYQLDIWLAPDVERFRAFDFLKTNRILEASRPLREDLKRALGTALDAFAARQ